MRVLHLDPEPFDRIAHRSAASGGGARIVDLPLHRVRVDALPAGLEAIVMTSDLQGREIDGPRLLGEVVAEHLLSLADLGGLPTADRVGIVIAGDMYAAPNADVRGASGDVAAVWDAFGAFRWVVGVAGNHDLLAPGRALDGEVLERDDLRIAGLSGIIGNPRRPLRWAEGDYLTAARRLAATADLLVLHESPEAGSRKGRPALTAALSGSGTLAVCGHVHWSDPVADLDGFQAVNVDGRVLVVSPIGR